MLSTDYEPIFAAKSYDIVCPTNAPARASAPPKAQTSAALNHILRLSRRISHCHRVNVVPFLAGSSAGIDPGFRGRQ